MDRLSALMDGEASRRDAEQALARVKQNGECLEVWDTFHLIGDVMRGNHALPVDFTPRILARMEQEPTLLAPRYTWRKGADFALAAAASFAAVAVVLALVLSDSSYGPQLEMASHTTPHVAVAEPKVAAVPQPIVEIASAAQAEPQPVASQGRVNDYLMAHQEFSPSTALQGVAPYVRTVSMPRLDSSR